MKNSEKNEGMEDEWVVELIERSKDFEQQFSDPESLTPVQIFEKLGFHEIDFKKLDPELQRNIGKKRDWYGHPLNETGEIKEDSIIMLNPDTFTMYFLCKNGSPGLFEWSCVKKSAEGGFEVHEMSPSSDIKGVIGNVSLLEIIGNQNPDTGMPLMPPKAIAEKLDKTPAIVEKARDDIEKL